MPAFQRYPPKRTGRPCQLQRPGCSGDALAGRRGCLTCQRQLKKEMRESGYLGQVPDVRNLRKMLAREDVRETRSGPIDPIET